MKKTTTFLLSLMMACSVQAHMLWLERGSDQKTKAFFGEYSEQVQETQEGALKSFNETFALQNQNKIKANTSQSDHLLFDTKGNTDVQLSHQLIYGDALLSYHAKTGRLDLTGKSELDISPITPNSNTFIVLYQGKAVSDLKIKVFAPNRWEKNYKTNPDGKVTIETPWQGQYIIEVATESDQAGTFNQQPYKKHYLVTTLSFNH